MRLIATLLLAALLLTLTAYLRPPEYDEAYSIFLTAGDARPAWPPGIFHPKDVRDFYNPAATPKEIAHDLRIGDVHPPLYFWLLEYWRRVTGPSWFAARMLSVIFSISALAALAWLATLAEIPVTPSLLIALLSYGFAYTGTVARGFALAQFLNILGVSLTFYGSADRKWKLALLGGIAFGAATCSNYLAIFIALATVSWLLLTPERRRFAIPTSIGIASFLPAIVYFFIAQHNARNGQFAAFAPLRALRLLAKDAGAALFGGLPLYAGQEAGVVTAALSIVIFICAIFIIRFWQPRLLPFALAAAAMPIGLLALGFIFNNTPIEIRYLAFGIPFLALLLAATLPQPWLFILLSVEACGIVGLDLAPTTMQPQGIAAREAGSLANTSALVLVPFGNDGVGIPGPFIAAAPADLRLQLITANIMPGLIGERRIILVTIAVDAASKRATADALTKLTADPCWAQKSSTAIVKLFIQSCGGLQTAH